MPAFDSTSNFNASWSNSFATVVLAPGSAVAAGFARGVGSGKRYFEFVVDTNPTQGNLYLGLLFRGGISQLSWLFGSDASGSWLVANPTGNLGSRLPSSGSTTWAAGDVMGVAVNYSMDGVGGYSSLTFSDGRGTNYFVVEVSRNGSFFNRIVGEAVGALIGTRPLVAQAMGTTLSANVTLRVDSLSFSYRPTGYSEWGASGGVSITNGAPASTISWGWTTVEKDAQWSISASTSLPRVAWAPNTISGSNVYQSVRTQALPRDHKSYFEILQSYSVSYNNAMYFGVGVEGAVTYPRTPLSASQTGFLSLGNIFNKSGFGYSGSATGGQFAPAGAAGIAVNLPKWYGVMYDPARGIVAAYGAYMNHSLSGAEVGYVNIETCRPIASFTSSVCVHATMYYGTFNTENSLSTMNVWVNDGYQRLRWPLYPGWRSVNNQRFVTTGGESWFDKRTTDTISTTYTVVNDIVVAFRNANTTGPSMTRSTGGHASGKKYFELAVGFNTIALGSEALAGIALGTMTWTNGSLASMGTFIGVGLHNGPQFRTFRQGVTISALASFTEASFSTNGEMWRPCVAVDIDNGRMWIGTTQANGSTRVWHGGGDPSAGTNPTATFSASTTVYCAVGIASNAIGQIPWTAAWQDGALRFDPPTGFEPWDSGGTPTTTTATVTPSVTGTASASGTTGSSGVKWPFGVRP